VDHRELNDKEDGTSNLRQYLLGALAEEPQQRLEEEMMLNSKAYEDLLIEEDELIDDYLWDNLSSADRQKFHETFLCTKERQRKLRFARAFLEYIQLNTGQKAMEAVPVWWQRFWAGLRAPSAAVGYPIAAVLLLAVLGSMWLNLRFQRQLDQFTGENARLYESQQGLQQQLSEERSRRDELASDLSREQDERERLARENALLRESSPSGSATSVPTVASFLLAPGLLRSMGDTERVIVPADASLVQLQLDLGLDDYGTYRIALHDAEGDEIWTQSKLKAEAMTEKVVVAVTFPAILLPHGDYSLRLSGLTPAGDYELVARYYFRAIPQ
jgi:hypothetical protein